MPKPKASLLDTSTRNQRQQVYMGSLVIRVLGHAATHAVVHRYAERSGRRRTKRGWDLFKDRRVPINAKFSALSIGMALTWVLVLLQVPFEVVLGLIIPFFFDEAAMLFVNGLEIVLLPILIGSWVLPRLVSNHADIAPVAPPVIGNVIDMPPPMLLP